ncbi:MULTISPECIES: hypothetical protein [unclassified Microcystis]|uniref:hypothetical protein n=1 Tax=unclassified Microcystis TaxID=2643300 RepID=UPI002589936A|nr:MULTISPECIES: hypothetical protein [unclassified Microcystis]MCA2561621.1 hypothetical protein [Microcystis sp. M40BS1]MCA2576718.1 hypothetical protein [Microcystis sp. M41BS1]
MGKWGSGEVGKWGSGEVGRINKNNLLSRSLLSPDSETTGSLLLNLTSVRN